MVRAFKRTLSVSLGAAKKPKTMTIATSSAPTVQDKLLKLTREVGKLKQVTEKKEFCENTTLTPTTTVQVLDTGARLYKISQGDGPNARTGQHIVITRVRAEFLCGATAGGEVGLALVQVKNCRGASAATAEIWSAGPSGTTLTSFMMNKRNLEGLENFNVLFHQTKRFTPYISFDGTSQVYSDVQRFSIDVKKRIIVRYDANAGVITDLAGNNLQFMYASQVSTGGQTGPFNICLEYEDV